MTLQEPPEEDAVESVESELEVERGLAEEATSVPPAPPTVRERLKPLELLGISAACAVFAGVITLLVLHPWGDFATHAANDWLTVGVVFGVAFIIALVVLAMLSLGGYEPQQPPSPKGYLVDNERREDRGH